MIQKSIIQNDNLFNLREVLLKAVKNESATHKILSAYSLEREDQGGKYRTPEWIEQVILENRSQKFAQSMFASIGLREVRFLIYKKKENSEIKISNFSDSILEYSSDHILEFGNIPKENKSGLEVLLNEFFSESSDNEELLTSLNKWSLLNIEKKRKIFNLMKKYLKENSWREEKTYQLLEILLSPVYSDESTHGLGRTLYINREILCLNKEDIGSFKKLIDLIFDFLDSKIKKNIQWSKIISIFNLRLHHSLLTHPARNITEAKIEQEKETITNIHSYGYEKLIEHFQANLPTPSELDSLTIHSPENSAKEIQEKFKEILEDEYFILFPSYNDFDEKYINSQKVKNRIKKYQQEGFKSIKRIVEIKIMPDLVDRMEFRSSIIQKTCESLSEKELNLWTKEALSFINEENQAFILPIFSTSISKKQFLWEKYFNKINNKNIKTTLAIKGLIYFSENNSTQDLNIILPFIREIKFQSSNANTLLNYLQLATDISQKTEDIIMKEDENLDVVKLFIVNFLLKKKIPIDRKKKYFDHFTSIFKNHCYFKENEIMRKKDIPIRSHTLSKLLKKSQELAERILDALTSSETISFENMKIINDFLPQQSLKYKLKIIQDIFQKKYLLGSDKEKILNIIEADDELSEKILHNKNLNEYRELFSTVLNEKTDEQNFKRICKYVNSTIDDFNKKNIFSIALEAYLYPTGTRWAPKKEYQKFDKTIQYLKKIDTSTLEDIENELRDYLIKELEKEREKMKKIFYK